VPIGKDDSENVELEKFGEPVVPDFEIPYHTEIMERFNGIDMEAAGAIMIVLEVIPNDLAEAISKQVNIPVIGIGAGSGTDGQVLVYHDVLQYGQEHRAKFVKVFGDFTTGVDALRRFNEEVKTGQFPSEEFTYKAKVMEDVTND
ncbi:MAG: 3-methyl-2-oxobutanoate hydroxymethyltransferase, partial [Macrococcus canis]|uniref:3-methyl-2-oxobutanoate hydroxymethyltransferase n=1 Tax=Macrococcoides canis TaxID=1855823 RepID=UPI002E7A802F